MSKPRESAYFIHGRLMGDPEARVRWTVNENEVNKSGIYEQLKFAIIVRHADQTRFSMALRIRVTTLAGYHIIGNGGSRIIFTPNQRHDVAEDSQQIHLDGLDGGSISTCGQTWKPAVQRSSGQKDLADEDLEELTRMEAILLGRRGPGVPAADSF